jgi:L-alanine-DL-glutamate epimerase-like enolase superfamily enzyme
VAEAKRFSALVEDCDLAWFEEPVSADDRAGIAEFRASTMIPVAIGESECTRFDFAALISARAADILQPDPAFCGGITEAMRIAALASSFNLRLAPHLWAGAPCFFAGLHVLAAAPAGYIVEFSLGANPMIHNLSRAPVVVTDGMIAVPEGPGLGLEMDTEMIARYARN